MDNLEELLEQMLCKAYTKIIYGEEKILKDMIGDKLSLKEFHTLDVIFNTMATGTNTSSTISKSLGITLSTLTINLDRLIAKGYVKKVKHDDDRRVTYISLTDTGNQIRMKHENLHKKAVQKAIKSLSSTEKVALLNAVNKLEF